MQLDPDIVQNPLPFEYLGDSDVDQIECNKPVEVTNACLEKCQAVFEERGGNELSLCDDNNVQVWARTCILNIAGRQGYMYISE